MEKHKVTLFIKLDKFEDIKGNKTVKYGKCDLFSQFVPVYLSSKILSLLENVLYRMENVY